MKRNKKKLPSSADVIPQLLDSLQCKYESGEDDYRYMYQNGHFVIDVDKEGTRYRLYFSAFYEVPEDDLPLLEMVCNDLNVTYYYYKFIFSYHEDDNVYTVNIVADENVTDNMETDRNMLINLMEGCFFGRSEFEETYKERAKEGTSQDDVTNGDHKKRWHYLQNKIEMSHWDIPLGGYYSEDDPLTMAKLLYTLNSRWVNQRIDRLRIIHDTVYEVTNMDEILTMKILGWMLEGEGRETHLIRQNVSYVLEMDKETVLITLTAQPEDEFTLYFRLMCQTTGSEVYNTEESPSKQPSQFSFLIAYYKSTDQQKQAEYDYMSTEQTEETNPDIPKGYLSSQQVQMGYEGYWGRKLFNQGCYYQALTMYESAFRKMQPQYDNLTDSGKGQLFFILHMIGVCYNKLGLYAQAFCYLLPGFEVGDTETKKQFINSVVNSQDFRADYYVHKELARIVDWMRKNAEQEGTEDYQEAEDYYNFLMRRKVYIMIEQKQYEEARSILNNLLEVPEQEEFAQKELFHLDEIKDEEQSKNVQE